MKDNTEQLLEPGAFIPMNGFVPPHMVQIPLEEYRRYIESTIKGPAVEIPLEEYNRLREDNRALQDRLHYAEEHIRKLETDIERQRDLQDSIDEHTDVVTRMVADEITEKVMKDLLQLTDEQKKEIRAKWQIVTDSDTKNDKNTVGNCETQDAIGVDNS